jgi:Fic/DOC family
LNCTASCLRRAVAPQASGIWAFSNLPSRSPGHRSAEATFIPLYREDRRVGLALAQGHPFVDGNKRVAHAAMATFLLLNNADIAATVDEQERLMLNLASGRLSRSDLVDWLREHVTGSSGQAV